MKHPLFLLVCLLWTAAACAAPVRTEHVEAELIAEQSRVQAGETLSVALRLKPIPHWHTYWRNPGDSGQPTEIAWSLPRGASAGPIQWPVPQLLPAGPLMNFGYAGEVLLLTDIALPRTLEREITLIAAARWLVCNAERCVPESARLSLRLSTGSGAPSVGAAAIAHGRTLLPRKADALDGWRLEASRDAGQVQLRLNGQPRSIDPGSLRFFPYDEGKFEHAAAQTYVARSDGVQLALPLAAQAVGQLSRLRGVLVAERALTRDGAHAVEIDLALEVVPPAAVVPPASGLAVAGVGVGIAMLFAFMGGMLLNLMPCVLPVLAIKVLGFANHSAGAPAGLRVHALFYAAGVLVSCWVLAAALIALKTFGQAVGWGFQLQSPQVISLLALLFFGLALNLSGVFEIGHLLPGRWLAARGPSARTDAFLTGVLAVAVASPCTAPFMGAAMGYAFAQGTLETAAVFSALGLGLAAPYVLLAWFPRGLRWVPKPGPWMVRLRQLLAFPLYATVIWLAWVLGLQAGMSAAIMLLVGLLVLALAVWLAGMGGDGRALWPRRIGTALLSAAAVMLAWPAAQQSGVASGGEAAIWEAYSETRVAQALRDGQPVFIDFTAAWCVSCQLNKKLVLQRADVQNAFKTRNVLLLRADWTRQDDVITRALASLGRNGVPVYVLHLPGQPPRLLPEILTRDTVISALESLPLKEHAT